MAEGTREGMPPFIISQGNLQSPEDIFISGEREILLRINGGYTSALITLLLLYFVCNIQYPKECTNVYLFLQRYVLKVYDIVKLPTKVLQFLNELNSSC